jgi:HK97 family phage prohead protease
MTDVDRAEAQARLFRFAPAEFKFANPSMPGSFEGYGSVFGVIDDGNDVVAHGAFAETLAQRKAAGRALPPMYMQHGRRMGADARPIGVWNDMAEDAHGLKSAGHLVGLDTETGKYNHALIKEGAMRGLSIGYRALKTGTMRMGTRMAREIKQADLFEVSVVDDPMNAQARIASVKSADQINTIRDFEDLLRDAGFSSVRAKLIAARGFKSSEPRDEDGALTGLRDALRRMRRSIR